MKKVLKAFRGYRCICPALIALLLALTLPVRAQVAGKEATQPTKKAKPAGTSQAGAKSAKKGKATGKAGANESKPASESTKAANAKVRQALDFQNTSDFTNAEKNLLFKPPIVNIPNPDPNRPSIWNLEPFKSFILLNTESPASVNPSLYRNAQLNMIYGLFKVIDNIYQVRGYDLSNITFVKSSAGWIVFDPLTSRETAAAALQLVKEKVENLPIVAVVYSHSHIDHYGGVRALGTDQEFAEKKIQVIAPEGFTEHAVSENVIAGNAMSRRAIYMYGALLPPSPFGLVNSGLGQTNSTGEPTLVLPTDIITETRKQITIGDVTMEFQLTPGTEAPAEMNTWFPKWNALWMAENTTNTFHNVLTLRGAQVRDPLKWASYLDQTIDWYGDKVQVKFQSHHWPVWGNVEIIDYFKKQRDLYKYTHDQTVNLMNKGYTGEEISEIIELPPSLDRFWPDRGYYGTLRHNSRAVYQLYMGWYDGNPSNLNNLPPEEAAKKYVEYMGGWSEIKKHVDADLAGCNSTPPRTCNYRWAAEVLKHVVFAEPSNTAAKFLLADVLEQLGYQAESGPWRNVYLMGAYELRRGVPAHLPAMKTASPDTIRAMPPAMVFDYAAVRLNGPKAWGKLIKLNVIFTDLQPPQDAPETQQSEFGLTLENAVFHYGKKHDVPQATATLTKSTLDEIQIGSLKVEDAIAQGLIVLTGPEPSKFKELIDMLDCFPFWFNIVTPREGDPYASRCPGKS